MQAFHEVRFPTAVSFGATGGPERRNEIVALTSGRERRNLRLAHSRRHYDAGTGIRSIEDLQEIVAFFEARRGSYHGFRFRDPFDMKSCGAGETPSPLDQPIGTGGGGNVVFQLVKTYGAGEDAYVRTIDKPVEGSVRIAVAGEEASQGSDFTVDWTTGVVTFSAESVPGDGQAITAGYQFDVPVRFDTERLEVNLTAFRAGRIPSIPIVEIVP